MESLLRLAERTDLFDDPEIQRLVAAASLTDTGHLIRRIEQWLTYRAAERQSQPFDWRLPDIARDRMELGTAPTGSRVALAEDDLTQHLLTIGQSGAGKTTLFYNLMDQVSVPFWAFDLKQDYRHLVQNRDDLLVLPWTRLKLNPLKPPEGVPPRRWAQVFAEIFGHATALLSGSKNYVMKAVVEIYRMYGLFDEVTPPYPSLHELRLLAERDRINYVRKTANYRDTVLNRLEAMTLTAGTVFDCSEGYPVEDLMERDVVFEFDGLGSDLQNFLMEILFAHVYEHRVAKNQRGGALRHVFFLDEGKRVFSVYKERQDAAGIPAIDELTARMREFGEGLVVADQEATKLTDSLKANTYTKVLLATGDAKQFEEIAGSMHLTERQRELAATLGIGEAIVQTGNRDPVPVRLDRYDLEKAVTDRDLRHRMPPVWDGLAHTPRKIVPALFAQESDDDTDIPDDPDPEVELSESAERFLRDVVERPFRSLTERYEEFPNAYQGNKAKDELLDAGLVVEREVRAKSARRKLLELTEKGKEYLGKQGVEAEQRGRGGVVHRYWQNRVMDLFADQGWTAKMELFDADVYATDGTIEVVVEVAMGNNAREIEHVKRHLATGFDAVWVACRNEEVRAGLRDRLQEEGSIPDRVALRLVSDFCDAGIGSLAQLGGFGAAEERGSCPGEAESGPEEVQAEDDEDDATAGVDIGIEDSSNDRTAVYEGRRGVL